MNKDHNPNPSESKRLANSRASFSDLVISQIIESSKGSEAGQDSDSENDFNPHKMLKGLSPRKKDDQDEKDRNRFFSDPRESRQ